MTTTEDALPARDPYIVAEAAEGVAYRQLPTPKGAVLLSITATVADLNSKITTVSDAELCCIQACPNSNGNAAANWHGDQRMCGVQAAH